jgi:hypothetical protein
MPDEHITPGRGRKALRASQAARRVRRKRRKAREREDKEKMDPEDGCDHKSGPEQAMGLVNGCADDGRIEFFEAA